MDGKQSTSTLVPPSSPCSGLLAPTLVGAVTESWMTVSVAESPLVQAMLLHCCTTWALCVRVVTLVSWGCGALASSPWQGIVQAFKVRAVIVVELL
jgi:hypothetical protein